MFDNAGTVILHEKEVQSIKMGDLIIYQKSENTPLYTVHILFNGGVEPPGVVVTTDSDQIMVDKASKWSASLPKGTQTITCPSIWGYGSARVTQNEYDIRIRYDESSELGVPVTYVIEEVSQ